MEYPQTGEGVVVLLSGGMDSCTLLMNVLSLGCRPLALSLRYGSKHQDAETEAAKKIVEYINSSDVFPHIDHEVRDIPAGTFFNSGLIDGDLPSGRGLREMEESGIAPSYVPMRNTVFLAIAGAFADAMDYRHVAYGAHREDHVGYPDCRPEYFTAMSQAMTLGSKNGVQIYDPFIWRGKDRIVQMGAKLNAPLHLTHTCYLGESPACGTCDTCIIRLKAFKDAGFIDPIPYAITVEWNDNISHFFRARAQ